MSSPAKAAGSGRVVLERTSRAPEQARRALDGLSRLLAEGSGQDVRLLVSELVTNSVLHSGDQPRSWVELGWKVDGEILRVEVTDPGPGFSPKEPEPDPYAVSGRGLSMVRALAERWGVDAHGITRVWFEIRVRPASDGAMAAAGHAAAS